MTATNEIELNGDLQARASESIHDARVYLDRRWLDRESTANFNEGRYLDTRPTLHMTATWGN
jgi:hypothetical protein